MGDGPEAPCFRLEIGRQLKKPTKLSVVTGRGGEGVRERGPRQELQEECWPSLLQPRLPRQLLPFIPRPTQKNGALENRWAWGSSRGPWQW